MSKTSTESAARKSTGKKTAAAKSKTTKKSVAAREPEIVTVAPVEAVAPVKQVQKSSGFAGLVHWNKWLAIILAVQAAVIAIFGPDRMVSVTTNYLAVDPLASGAAGHEVFATATRTLFDVRISVVVAFFLLVFAVVFALTATSLRKRYEARLAVGMSDSRWVAIAAGGGALAAAVALLSGITALSTLLMLFVLVAGGALAVLCAEEIDRREQPNKKALLSHVACAIGFGGLLTAVVVFALNAAGAWLYGGSVPGYLLAIYAVIVVCFIGGFLLAHFRMLRRGKLADIGYTEKRFMLLVLVLASVTAWLLFAGA